MVYNNSEITKVNNNSEITIIEPPPFFHFLFLFRYHLFIRITIFFFGRKNDE